MSDEGAGARRALELKVDGVAVVIIAVGVAFEVACSLRGDDLDRQQASGIGMMAYETEERGVARIQVRD